MTPFEAYQTFLAIKQHFNTSYDYFKYGGKVKAPLNSFESRRDKFYFQKLARHRDLHGLLVANFIDRDVKWVGDLISDESEAVYKEWKKRSESLTYTVTQELDQLSDDFISFFRVKDGQHPPLLVLFKQKKISIETLAILNNLLSFFEIWDKKIYDPVVWPSIRTRVIKYQPFIHYDKSKLKKVVKQLMNDDK
jgi:hypothetical protein